MIHYKITKQEALEAINRLILFCRGQGRILSKETEMLLKLENDIRTMKSWTKPGKEEEKPDYEEFDNRR